jgi:hypothetical protein
MSDENAAQDRPLPVLGPPGRPKKGEEKGDAITSIKRGSTGRDYILARLDRDGHAELAANVRAFKMSASSAAVAAGFRKTSPPILPSYNEEMDLWLGFQGKSAYPTDEARRAGWFRHREYIMTQHARDGFRPIGWWHYESPIELPRGGENQAAALYEGDLLDPGERERLVASWRRDFDDAQRPGFTYLTSKYTRLEGETAKRAHYRSAGIPKSLVIQWTNERRAMPPPNAA